MVLKALLFKSLFRVFLPVTFWDQNKFIHSQNLILNMVDQSWVSKLNPYAKTIQMPMDYREFPPPSYEESQKMKKLEDDFEKICEQDQSPPKTQRSPLATSAPSATIYSSGNQIFTIYSTGCFGRIDKNRASDLSMSDENFTVCFDENPVNVEVNIEDSESPVVKDQPKPLTVRPKDEALFCTPDDCTIKGWCICFFSRCFFIFAYMPAYYVIVVCGYCYGCLVHFFHKN